MNRQNPMDRKSSSKAVSNGNHQQMSWFQRVLYLWSRLERFTGDIFGIVFLALAAIILLSLIKPNLTVGWVHEIFLSIRRWFGWGTIWVSFTFIAVGLWLIQRRSLQSMRKTTWGKVIMVEVIAFSSLPLLALMGGNSMERADAGLDGGRIGWGLAALFREIIQPLGLSGDLFIGGFLVVIILLSLLSISGFSSPLSNWMRRIQTKKSSTYLGVENSESAVSEAPLFETQPSKNQELKPHKRRNLIPPQFRKNLISMTKEADQNVPPPRNDRLPPLDLLVTELASRPNERNINSTAGLIEKTLAEFGIPAKVVGYRMGPTVTQFAVEPGYLEKEMENGEIDPNRQKIRVAQISALQRDLALSLAAERLRIEAPVPGRPYVGIEVPNTRSIVVRLRPILEQESFYKMNSPLGIAIGRDVSGQPVVADLARMPHLLIAGTTGSGKSVFIAALTTCLAMNNSPGDLRLVMVDPKMVELVRFNGLPHLFGKVETEIERIIVVLRWAMSEMDRRYKILENSHSRNIESYNRKARRRKGEEPLPHIVVMIDELADLMMSIPDQTEPILVRLAQMARATGIHLVLATQRPSTDVVTGLIKANFPARVSFSMASSIDSRVILDSTGAETLLGHGDMLFLPPEVSAPIRVQGVMVSDQEVERMIDFWQKSVGEEQEDLTPPWEEMIQEGRVLAERDDLLDQAIALVRKEQRASASMLQRRLRIGYPRAARLIDELEESGVIGPAVSGGRERDVLIDPIADEDFL